MKAFGIKQPWAELIVSEKKTIELRNWNTSFRGEFPVRASLNPNKQAMNRLGFAELPLGCIVDNATLVSVKTYQNKQEFDADAKNTLRHPVGMMKRQKDSFCAMQQDSNQNH